MKTHLIRTYWTADEAESVITLLADLRDLLWECYGPEIIEMHRQQSDNSAVQTTKKGQPFDDEIDF